MIFHLAKSQSPRASTVDCRGAFTNTSLQDEIDASCNPAYASHPSFLHTVNSTALNGDRKSSIHPVHHIYGMVRASDTC